ncbi:MAG: ATP-binding protein [Planctomycetota bacterium]|jgi:anti-sigma regulatory factor (Ser/Thr protein kinase)
MSQDRLKMKIKLKPPIGKRAVRAARKAICALAEEWKFSEQACREIELCFSEALHNAMEHGSSGKEKTIVKCEVDDKGMRIEIEDRGAGVGDVQALKEAFDKVNEHAPDMDNERGRGIYLIRNLMDESKLEFTAKGGVRITMLKKRS